MESELAGFKSSDTERGFIIRANDYNSVDEYAELIESAIGKKCGHPECQNVIGGRRSCDRINNSLGHVKRNIRLLCSMECNSSLR